MSAHLDIKQLEALSPFEFRDRLIEVAKASSSESGSGNVAILNAGRGNPNFFATAPRDSFFQLGLFAMNESKLSSMDPEKRVGGFPKREGIENRFKLFCTENSNVNGVAFLRDAVSFVRDNLELDVSQFLYEMCEAILACNYPVPDRMLVLSEQIVRQYIRREMFGTHPLSGEFDLFAVEGGTAAMTYIFNSLRINGLLSQGDTIALGLPIFSPYMEIPHLSEYGLNIINIYADKDQNWQFTEHELDKLRETKVKAFFLVNPTNPTSVKLNDKSVAYIASIVNDRPDLIILTDDVYGTFADNFVSLFAECPKNTILVYSFSKYFGATGWRLGVIGIHHNNIIDEKIAKLDNGKKTALHKRYESITPRPDSLKFIDRLVADSRSVALNHTAGLSTPQQVQMVLFSLFGLMDTSDSYKNCVKKIVRDRKLALCAAISHNFEHEQDNVDAVHYYLIVDFEKLAEHMHDSSFASWLPSRFSISEILLKLAEDACVILLPGQGFGASRLSGRVSLANLSEAEYTSIGKALKDLVQSYLDQYKRETPQK
ncbi:unnamed protein product [Rotaria socialis]|uniref:Aminotransferase class I/classII large domain-containing protein n=1 Tax=Rotaria socialis TaxID=392032 RepID=A0A820ZJ21_9BILA|nr:unnamed protein product [Rotaria socialis]CAF4558057.1 unnamed protein product [Rotaria socialis]